MYDKFKYHRRHTSEVRVGGLLIGSSYPVRVQSMTTTNTNDTEACILQAEKIIQAGGELVRLTTQGTREAENLRNIRDGLRAKGYDTPLVADVHFNANVADVAARIVEKVRINPGNYVDPARRFRHLEYTDGEYADEIKKIEQRFVPLLDICKAHHTALRIGVNHGSLSDRIMSRYGDTPEGIVESCLEFLRIARRENFPDIVISIKASNTVVMVKSVRLLVEAMDKEDMHYPLHLGVTEAGEGEDGRIKSAVGIGALLTDGIGDTIRVSLSEAPEAEIPVARQLTAWADTLSCRAEATYVPVDTTNVQTSQNHPYPIVVGQSEKADFTEVPQGYAVSCQPMNSPHLHRQAIARMREEGIQAPVIIHLKYQFDGDAFNLLQLQAAADAGALMMDGLVQGLWIENEGDIPAGKIDETAFSILQAGRLRMTKTEYISCPGCGRTLYDLQQTIARIKEATKDMTGLKIGIMGCIVNGPGEMADADFGYVGAGPGRVSLYRQKECVEKNIPEDEAVERLLALIRESNNKNIM